MEAKKIAEKRLLDGGRLLTWEEQGCLAQFYFDILKEVEELQEENNRLKTRISNIIEMLR